MYLWLLIMCLSVYKYITSTKVRKENELCKYTCRELFNPNRSFGCYAQTHFLFVISIPVSRLQWNPIAPSKRKYICSKIEDVIIITLMADLGFSVSCCRCSGTVPGGSVFSCRGASEVCVLPVICSTGPSWPMPAVQAFPVRSW